MADDDSEDYHTDDSYDTEDSDEDHADRTNNYFHRQGSLESEFICGCCSDLLVQPTTLTCGHSFCRLCLAQWYNQSKKRTCPLCQQPYVGSPSVNITIKNLIEKTYSHKLREREIEVYTEDNDVLIKTFEENRPLAHRHIAQRNNNVQVRDFCSGILVMGGVILLVYLVMYWKSVGTDMLIHKPPARWSSEDVVQWLSDLGSWTTDYQETARHNGIDGRLLLAVDHASLQSSLNVTNDLHIKAISTAIQQLKDFNMKLPASLWEYKALNPGRSLFLVYGIKDFPRTTMLYIYLFEYDEIFLPFLHSTFPENSDIPIIHMFDDPTRRQEIEFWSTFAVLPYWVVAKFCWSWFDVHFWISMLMFFNCATLTFIEAITFKKSFPIRKENCLASLKSYGKGLVSMVFFVVIWPVVPSLVCDFLFYSVLFFTPYHNVDKIRKELR